MIVSRRSCRLVLAGSSKFFHSATSLLQRGAILAPENCDLFAACVLQRFPVVQPPLSEMEQRANDLFRTMEIRSSLLSDHELRHRNDQAILKKRQKAAAAEAAGTVATTTSTSVESGPFVTALEAEDMWEAEKNKFVFGPKKTEADEKNDTTSTKRRLDRKLTLVVEQKIGKDFQLVLPQAQWKEGESLRQTAERALLTLLPGAKPAPPFPPLVQFLGNAPCGVYSYRYPKGLRQQLKRHGAKVFFYKAHLMDWQMALQFDGKDLLIRKPQWLAKDEMLKTAMQKDYARTIGKFILDF